MIEVTETRLVARLPGHCVRGHDLSDPDSVYTWVDRQGRTHRKCKECTLGRKHGTVQPNDWKDTP